MSVEKLAEEIIAELRTANESAPYNGGVPFTLEEMLTRAIRKAYKAAEPRWKRCEDELPEETDRYIVKYKQGNREAFFVADYDAQDKYWLNTINDTEIIEWMPIPGRE